MRDTITVAGWVGGAMLICVSLLVLCQHAEGERTRAALQAEQAHVDGRIRTLDARLTDMQADVNRKKLASVVNPPLDPKRLAKASQELDRLIATPSSAASKAPAPPTRGGQKGQVTTGTLNPDGATSNDSSVPTVDSAAGGPVRVCAGGHFYHRPGCKRVQKQTMTISRADAERRGWKPCPTCRP